MKESGCEWVPSAFGMDTLSLSESVLHKLLAGESVTVGPIILSKAVKCTLTAQEEEWNRRLASSENLFFVTEEAMKESFDRYSEQA